MKNKIMKNIILLSFVLMALFSKAQQDELLENDWYLQKIILDNVEYITPINDEVNAVSTQFYDSFFTASVCNLLMGGIQYHSSGQSFTLSDVSTTLVDCELTANFDYESLYFGQFFFTGTELAHPFTFSIEEQNDYLLLTITNLMGVQAVYHSQNTVSVSESDHFVSRLQIFPNPTNNTLVVSLNNPQNKKQLSLNICNLLGQVIVSELLIDYQNEIDISNLNSGIFILKIFDEQGTAIYAEKIIKE